MLSAAGINTCLDHVCVVNSGKLSSPDIAVVEVVSSIIRLVIAIVGFSISLFYVLIWGYLEDRAMARRKPSQPEDRLHKMTFSG